jgi:hypothetical protein
MAQLRNVVLVAALLACDKKSETDVGSKDPVGAAPAAAPAAAGSDASTSSAGSATGAAVSPELLKALDEMDRMLAPVFKLEPPERFNAFCAERGELTAKAQAIEAAPAPAGVTDWAANAKKLSTDLVGDPLKEPEVCCRLAPQGLKGEQEKTQNRINDDCVRPIHESFKKLVASVPGAPAADAHANDALPASAKKKRK